MFNFIKFATHFGQFNMGSFDPMVIELIREESEVHVPQRTATKAADKRVEKAKELQKVA